MATGDGDDDVSRAKKPPGKVTLAKNPPGKVTLAKNPPGPVTLAKNPPGPVTLAKNPPGPVTLAKNPPGPVTLAKNPPGPVTLAKNPPGPVTLAKNPPGPVTLAKNPPGPVTLAKNPPGPVTLAKNPTSEVSQQAHPSAPLTAPHPQRQSKSSRTTPRAPTTSTSRHQSTTKRTSTNLIDNFGRIGSTHRRRTFWNAARNAVLSLRKIAGRNVSVSEYPGKGTICDIGRTPGNTGTTSTGCTHTISFSVKFDQSEIDNDDSALLELRSVGAVFTLSANSSGWDFGGASVSGPWVADTWLDVNITITRGATNLIITLCVDGTCGTNTGTGFLTDKIFDTLRIGVPFGGMVIHHSCKNIIATGMGSETEFNFPVDSFDSLTTGATITTDGGDTVIRLDSDAAAVYGEKDLTTPWRLSCPGACCGDDACFTLSPYECLQLGGFYQGDGVSCDPDPCPSGACCNGDGFESCLATGPVHCESIGGHYYDGATCDPSPCPSPPPPAYCCRTGTYSTCIPDGECGTATGPGCPVEGCGEGSSCITWTTYEWRLVVNCDACNTEIGETCSGSPCARGGVGGCCYETGSDDYGAGACPSGGGGAFLPPP